MNYEIFIALCGFACATLFSPGPNNLMLMSSGMNFGFKKSLPHLFGVAFGFPTMVCSIGLGVHQIFEIFPASYIALKVLSIVYLLYLAWRIAMTKTVDDKVGAETKPLTFLQAAMFQWVNPKAWAMALTAISVYTPSGQNIIAIIIVAATFTLFGNLSASIWTILGQEIRRFLNNATKLRIFNIVCAVLIILSLIPILTQ